MFHQVVDTRRMMLALGGQEILTKDNVRVIRPAGGLAPKEIDTVLGMRAKRKASRGTPLTWDIVT